MPFTEMEKMEGTDLEVRKSEEKEELVLLHLEAFGTMCIESYRGDIRFLLSTQSYLGALLQLLKSLHVEDPFAFCSPQQQLRVTTGSFVQLYS